MNSRWSEFQLFCILSLMTFETTTFRVPFRILLELVLLMVTTTVNVLPMCSQCLVFLLFDSSEQKILGRSFVYTES